MRKVGTKFNSLLLVFLLFFQNISFATDKSAEPSTTVTSRRPSDTIYSEKDKKYMEETYGPHWEEQVNSDPQKFTRENGGRLPGDWQSKTLKPYGTVKPSQMISDPAAIEAIKKRIGRDDWEAHVDVLPEAFLEHLPSDWADQVRKGKDPESLASNNTTSSTPEIPSPNTAVKDGASNSSASDSATDSGSQAKKADGGSSMANQILALGTGIIGSNILLSCKLGTVTPSIMAFGAGSLVYIGSEIAGAKAQQAFIKVKKDEIAQLKANMVAGGDLQRGIIEAKIKEEEDKLGFVKKRKTWTMAVSAIYGAATGLAVAELLCITNKLTLPACTQWVVAGCEGGSSLPSSKLLSGALLGAYGFAVGNAGGTAVSRYGTALAAGLGVVVPSVSAKVAVAYQTPKARIVTFGAGTALAAAVMIELSKVQKDLEENIKDLKKLLADYEAKTNDPNGIKEGAQPIDLAKDNINLMQGSGSLNRLAAGADLNKHCWGKDGQGLQTYSEEACGNPLTLSKPKYNSKFSLPTLQTVANTGVDMAQAVARGDMGAADIAAASLANNAMRVNEIKDKLLADLKEQEKKAGNKAFDYDKAIQANVEGLKRGLGRGLSSKGINLASMPSSSTSLLDPKEEIPSSGEINSSKAEEGVALGVTGADESMDFNFGEGMDESMNFNEGGAEVAATHTLEDFETQESDILAQPETSIFKQLSNRYLLNYNRIFESKVAPKSETK